MMLRAITIAALAGIACTSCHEERRAAGSAPAPAPVVRRGDVVERLLLTGELDAVSSESLVVPKTPQWSLSIRWLENDGTQVTRGQKVAEFDNSAFANTLADQKLAAVQSANELALQLAQNAVLTADKQFELDKARIALDKARTEAAVPPDTMPKRVFQQKQLEVERAQVALAKATDDMEAHVKSATFDIKVRQIALEKAQRDIQTAEAAIESVVLRAPRDGIVVVADNPQEGRKLDVGDNVFVGLTVVRLPDLKKMKVNALLSDVDDGRVHVGMHANAYLDAYPDLQFPGTVTDVSPVAREPSQKSWRRSFLVTMMLDRTEPERMLPGMSVRVEIDGREAKAGLLAPRASVDLGAKPPRLLLGDGSNVGLESVICNAQSCSFGPAGGVHEGTVLRLSFAGGGHMTLLRALAPVVALSLVASGGCGNAETVEDWVAVRRDDLLLTVDVTGKLAAVNTDVLGPPMVPDKWDFKISTMAPEGTAVKQGDIVLSFDGTEQVRALEQKTNERDAILKEIEKALSNAKMQRRDEELRTAEAEAHVRKATLKLDRPTDLTGSLELAAARSDLELAKAELSYQQGKTAATKRQDEITISALTEKKNRADARIEETKAYLGRMTIAARRPSTVIYVTNWNDQKKKVGDSAWRQEKVLETAVLDEMVAKADIDEVDASKTMVGQRVTLRLDAVPDVTYGGVVKSIGNTVQRQSRKNPLKVVRLNIALDKTDGFRMRPGMRFQGTAETERIPHVLLVPTGAIFLTDQGPIAYRRTARGFEVARLELGKRNAAFAEVRSGLADGDEVSRVDRRQPSR